MGKQPEAEFERELSFVEHLDELRTRLIRMAVYWVAAAALGWHFREPLLTFLRRPAEQGAKLAGLEDLPFRIFDPIGGLMLALTTAAVGGLVLASPAILTELWLFIRPALRPRERRWFAGVVPMATLFFLGGIAFAYWMSVHVLRYMFEINLTLGVEGELALASYLSFILKMLIAMGFLFEVPILIMALAYVGLVRSDWLLARWRYLVVAAIIVTVLFTPAVDPLTLGFFAVPLLLLFFFSIWLVRIVERQRDKRQAREEAAQQTQSEEETSSTAQRQPAEESVPVDPEPSDAEDLDPFSFYEQLTQEIAELEEPEDETPGDSPETPPDEKTPPTGGR